MDKIFQKNFSIHPDNIVAGDYFYQLSHRDKYEAELTTYFQKLYPLHVHTVTSESFEEQGRLLHFWEETVLPGNKDSVWYEAWTEDIKAIEILNKIASDCKPFMDIASGETMGLTPYIVKMNPQIPCLITDMNASIIKNLRSFVNEHLSEYNLNFASFDNLDMPLKDNSLEYITSRQAISSSDEITPLDGTSRNIYQYSAGKEKPISEVFRILKPGGRFITLEMNRECDFDLQQICDYHKNNGKLFGVYTYREIQAVLELLEEEPWRDKFTAAGFEVELEEKHYKQQPLRETMRFLHAFTNYHGIRNWEKNTWEEQRKIEQWIYQDEVQKVKDIGVNFYDVDLFYILRKPD